MTRRFKDSLSMAFAIVTGTATLFTVLGLSLRDIFPFNALPEGIGVVLRAVIVLGAFFILSASISIRKYYKYRNEINIRIGKNDVTIKTGDIFKEEAWRVIGVDTHFDTEVDNVVISDTSLHGQLVLKHGSSDGIKEAVKKEAERRHLTIGEDGKYTFPLGSAVQYKGNDGDYLLVALTELDSNLEAHTKLPLYENTLMTIWREVYRTYAKHDIVLPVLGAGITRFDDHQDEPEELLRCMLCTLNTCQINFKSHLSIIIYEGQKKENKTRRGSAWIKQIIFGYKEDELPLYEYKDLFRIVRKKK